jgi:NAD(P)H-hydrate epimerase
MTEVMWQALPEDPQGGLSLEALNQIREGLDWCDVAVLGPGLSRFEETQQLARLLITEGQRPLVVDADAMMAWQGFEEHLVRHHGELILTPHPGEFAGVRGMDIAKVQSNRLSVAGQAARDWKSVVVLKGAFTAIAGEDGRCWVNPFAHSGLATAGSGDVLAGIVAGLWARRIRQGLDDRIEAACLGVWVHGQAGALASESCGASGLCAGDLLPVLGKVVDGLSRRRVQGSWDRMGILALSNRGE